ncbi:MAG: hypothetical protein ABSA02_06580 [Trebonia sp.]|jgi:hypothetical protein
MDNLKRSVVAVAAIGAAGAIAAAVPFAAQAATASGVRYLEEYASASFIGPGPSGMVNQCSVLLLSAAASDGGPAYVSGLLENNTTDACTGWLEDSVNGGAWTNVSPQVTLPATAQGLVNYPWAKTGNYYAGPGTRVRACVLTPAIPSSPAEPLCSSSSVTLASSTAAPPDDGTPVFYDHNPQAVSEGSGDNMCSASLNSGGSLGKTATSQASMTLSGTGSCAGWLETSADNGATWEQATPTSSLTLSNPRVELAFSPAVADGAGQLARACVQNGTQAKVCTAAW